MGNCPERDIFLLPTDDFSYGHMKAIGESLQQLTSGSKGLEHPEMANWEARKPPVLLQEEGECDARCTACFLQKGLQGGWGRKYATTCSKSWWIGTSGRRRPSGYQSPLPSQSNTWQMKWNDKTLAHHNNFIETMTKSRIESVTK